MFISLHPYLNRVNPVFTWMAGSSPAMTKNRKTGAAKRSTTANAIRATKHTLRGVASVEELEAWEELRGPGSVMAAPDLDPGAARLSPVHSVGVRWGLVRLFSGAAISDSSLSRRGVMARTPPDRGPGAAKTVELPRRTRRGLRDASAAQIRQHRRRRRQYRCIMSHSAAARR
jgi:hypothetical protein